MSGKPPESTNEGPRAGRPKGRNADEVKSALLKSARELFLSYEFEAVSTKRIAHKAGVNAAMINYYFGSKKELYRAMIDDVFLEMQERMKDLQDHSEIPPAEFIRNYTELMLHHPWWPNFMVKEVLFGDGEMKAEIVSRFGQLMMPKLLGAVRRDIASGELRDDLQPEMAMMSLIGLSIFPFLAKPMLEQLLGIKVNREAMMPIVEHNMTLFMHGALAKPQQSKP